MSDKSSIIINSTNQAGNEKSMSVGYINPDATPSEMIQFAQAINNLTQNVYRGATLVEKTELVNKPEPSMLVFDSGDSEQKTPITTLPFSDAASGFNLQVDTNSSGKVTIIKNTSTLWVRPFTFVDNDGTIYNLILLDNASSSYMLEGEWGKNYDNLSGERMGESNAGEVVIQVAETTQYAAKTWTITVTA